MAAYFSRADQPGLVLANLLFPAILLIRRRWVLTAARIMTLVGGVVWLWTEWAILQVRLEQGAPWVRMTIILTAVALFTAVSGLAFRSPRVRERYSAGEVPAPE